MSPLLSMLDELMHALAAFDPASVSHGECGVLAERLAAAANACETASARAAMRAPVARSDTFLARARGSTTHAARSAIATVAHATPEVQAALAKGEVSLAQAAAIAAVPEHAPELLELARETTLGPVKDAARKHRLATIKPDELREWQVAAQYVRTWKNDLGNVAFCGELPPELGVPFANRLDRETDRLWRTASADDRRRPREWHAARAFVQLCAGRMDASVGRADLVMVCDINAYRRGHAHEGEPCHIVGGGPIPASVARELAKDAFLKAVLHDGVNIHTVAHFGRHRPAVLQTALDLGAPPEFEGTSCTDCDRKYYLEWDHVDPRANGGLTSYANLTGRCDSCHDAKTERDRKAGLLGERPP